MAPLGESVGIMPHRSTWMFFPVSRYRCRGKSCSAVATRVRGSCLSWLARFLRLGCLCLLGVVYGLRRPLSAKGRVILSRVSTNSYLAILLFDRFGHSGTRTYFHTSGSSRPALIIRCCCRSGMSPRLCRPSL